MKIQTKHGGFLKGVRLGCALGLALLTASAFADVVGYFKFDNFSGDNGAFTDDAGKGLRGLLGFPFSAPLSVPGPSGQAGDLAVSLDGSGGLAADDSPVSEARVRADPFPFHDAFQLPADGQVALIRNNQTNRSD